MFSLNKDGVVIDHMCLDVKAVEKGSGKVIGRPWLTVAMDVPTRCVLEGHLSLEPPSDKPDSATAEFKRSIEERFGPIVPLDSSRRTPRFNGSVERVLGALNRDLINYLGGSNKAKDLTECSTYTMEELEEFIIRYITVSRAKSSR